VLNARITPQRDNERDRRSFLGGGGIYRRAGGVCAARSAVVEQGPHRPVNSRDGWSRARTSIMQAAFEAAVGPASNAIKLGCEVSIMVEGSEPALGAR
jgi:hypothetical protein